MAHLSLLHDILLQSLIPLPNYYYRCASPCLCSRMHTYVLSLNVCELEAKCGLQCLYFWNPNDTSLAMSVLLHIVSRVTSGVQVGFINRLNDEFSHFIISVINHSSSLMLRYSCLLFIRLFIRFTCSAWIFGTVRNAIATEEWYSGVMLM